LHPRGRSGSPDDRFKRAIVAGATEVQAPGDRCYGDRVAILAPFGHRWSVAPHAEDVSAEEMERRAAEVIGVG
jgi:uncharacterized glyoxalase superfamily protein PhnB